MIHFLLKIIVKLVRDFPDSILNLKFFSHSCFEENGQNPCVRIIKEETEKVLKMLKKISFVKDNFLKHQETQKEKILS